MKRGPVLLWLVLWGMGSGLAQGELLLRSGMDLGCAGPGGEVWVRQGEWGLGAEYYACHGASRVSLRLAYQPLPIPLEVGIYGGLLGGLPSYGLMLGGGLALAEIPGGKLGLSAGIGGGLTQLPTGHLLPGVRASLGMEARWTLALWGLGPGTPLGEGSSGAQCSPPTPESLMATFSAMAESTRTAVIASLSALYTDFSVEISDLQVAVEGQTGVIRGRYAVGATHRLTGRRATYTGRGTATFHHNGCSWQLVSYSY